MSRSVMAAWIALGLLGWPLCASEARAAESRPPRSSDDCAASSPAHRVFFAADDGTTGTETWVTDGTPEGTRLLKDIHPTGSSDPALVATKDDALYFVADDGVHGRELWRTDGTSTGTSMVKDLRPGGRSGFMRGAHQAVDLAGRTLFWASDRREGLTLWSTDGTPDGTWSLPMVGHPTKELVGPMLESEGALYFTVGEYDEGSFDFWRLWRTDGAAAGTAPVTAALSDPAPTTSGSSPAGSSIASDDAIVDGLPEDALDPMVGSRGVFFSAYTERTGRDIWHTDGTPDGTRLVIDLDEGGSSGPLPLAVLDGRLVFFAGDGRDERALWASDGLPGDAIRLAAIRPATPSRAEPPRPLAVIDRRAVFFAADRRGRALWVTDGTSDGTRRLAALRDSDVYGLRPEPVVADDAVYFIAFDAHHARQLWRTDGTARGTVRLTDLKDDWLPIDMAMVGRRVLLAVRRLDGTPELWVSDGTRRGTRRAVTTRRHRGSWVTPVFLPAAERGVLFVHVLRVKTVRSDGVAEDRMTFGLAASDGKGHRIRGIGGVESMELGLGPEELEPQVEAARAIFAPLAVDGVVYFTNPNPRRPARFGGLWSSDGTPEGTTRVSPYTTIELLAATSTSVTCPDGERDAS